MIVPCSVGCPRFWNDLTYNSWDWESTSAISSSRLSKEKLVRFLPYCTQVVGNYELSSADTERDFTFAAKLPSYESCSVSGGLTDPECVFVTGGFSSILLAAHS